jgi:hypothetical protein
MPTILVGKKHAAADGERAGRHVDFHAALVLGNLPADEAQHALAESGDDLALILLGVVDEFVDDEIGAWSTVKVEPSTSRTCTTPLPEVLMR